MAVQSSLLLMVLVNLLALGIASNVSTSFNYTSFPPGFVFGAASSAYQYEGAAKEGGKGPSIWDTFTHNYPNKILNGCNGDVADDFYHRYKGDIQLMKKIGLGGFRFSISWSRVLPSGKLSGGVNKEGIAFYNNLINELLSNGIQPLVTIFHWDLPQALEDEYGGFLSLQIIDDFRDFAELCFKEFGDRVKLWATINEPWSYSSQGYDTGFLAPGRCSAWMSSGCLGGNSATEPYVVAHHLLLSHAAIVKLYKEKYQVYTPINLWRLSKKHAYPRRKTFTAEQAMMVKGSFDFLGLNYYTGNYASNVPFANSINVSYSIDSLANLTTYRNGKPIGDPTGVSTFFVYPNGLRELLIYTKEKYNNPTIYITECGMGDANNSTAKQGVKDLQKINFYHRHLLALREAIKEGVNVKGFFAWSFMDNFEWNSGYTMRFGLVYVDFNDELKRYLKYSALWFKKFLLK